MSVFISIGECGYRVSSKYRVSVCGRCLYTYKDSLICAFNMITHYVTIAMCLGYWKVSDTLLKKRLNKIY